MGRLNAVASYTDSREELIIRLADVADSVRDAHAAAAAIRWGSERSSEALPRPHRMPIRCLLDCDPHHWSAWGPLDICTNCGTRPLPADTWHQLLTSVLRQCSPVTAGRRAA